MRRREFTQPNVTVTVQFVGEARPTKLILYGPARATAEEPLKLRYPGIQILDVVPYDFANQWEQRAKSLRLVVAKAIEDGEKYDFDKNRIWSELKDFLFDLFDGNCAYCECSLLGGSFGAVEHYRPKNPVLGVAGHPGYYWLAYDITNYLPTCTRCNTSKSNFFPVTNASPRAMKPPEERTECPLLLNPYWDNPTAHFMFTTDGVDQEKVGPVATGITAKGKESIRLLGLNRADIVPERLHEQHRALLDFVTQRDIGMKPLPVLEQLKAGKRPFSAAALAAVLALEKGFPSLGS